MRGGGGARLAVGRTLSVGALLGFSTLGMQDGGCGDGGGGCDPREVTEIAIEATLKTLVATTRYDETYSCWPFYCYALGSYSVGCGNVAAGVGKGLCGFQSWSDTGTLPCTCMWYRHCYYRTWAQFDIRPLIGKTVLGADLEWEWFSPDCVVRLFAAVDNDGSDPRWPANAATVIATFPQLLLDTTAPPAEGVELDGQGGTLAVGGTVFEWVENTLPDRGILFTGDQPGLFASTDSCIGSVGPVRLKVLVAD